MAEFAELIERLRRMLVEQVANGELTERGLARKIGMSQCHVHNVLHGTRMLTPGAADRILAELRLSITDLMDAGKIGAGSKQGNGRRAA